MQSIPLVSSFSVIVSLSLAAIAFPAAGVTVVQNPVALLT
jgi:hypothetical protein